MSRIQNKRLGLQLESEFQDKEAKESKVIERWKTEEMFIVLLEKYLNDWHCVEIVNRKILTVLIDFRTGLVKYKEQNFFLLSSLIYSHFSWWNLASILHMHRTVKINFGKAHLLLKKKFSKLKYQLIALIYQSFIFVFYLFHFCWWGSNPGTCACEASTVPLRNAPSPPMTPF